MNTREREVMAAARALAIRYQQPGEDVVARFERVAEMFRRETGLMAPGKDEPAAAYAGEESARERDDAWNAWSRKPVEDLIASIAAYDALLAEGSASSEGTEAVEPVAWRYVPLPNTEHPVFYKDAWLHFCPSYKDFYEQQAAKYGHRVEYAYLHPQPAQGEHERKCGCGLATCVEPWEPGCGLGMSKEHAVAVAGDVESRIDAAVAAEHEQSGDYWIESERGEHGEYIISNANHGECIVVHESESHDSASVARKIVSALNGEHEQRSCEGSEPVLERYGIDWRDPHMPVALPMPDGYWTPWHIAEEALKQRTSERRPIADEVVELSNSLDEDAALLRGLIDDGVGQADSLDRIADSMERASELLKSSLPRGLPAGSDAPFDIYAHLQRQREWSERTFGPGARTAGVVDHIRKELREIEADPKDVSEWIDVVILALDGAWRAGYSPREIVEAIVAKQTKNEGRAWPDWRTMPADKAIEHDRSADTTAEQPAGSDIGAWLWCKLMDWCKARRVHPVDYNDLFSIVADARKEIATAEQASCSQDARDAARYRWLKGKWRRH